MSGIPGTGICHGYCCDPWWGNSECYYCIGSDQLAEIFPDCKKPDTCIEKRGICSCFHTGRRHFQADYIPAYSSEHNGTGSRNCHAGYRNYDDGTGRVIFSWSGSTDSHGRMGKYDEQWTKHASDTALDCIVTWNCNICVSFCF